MSDRSDKSKCAKSYDTKEDLLDVVVCERKHGHKHKHRETLWFGNGSEAIKVTVEWKRRRKHG